MLHVIAHDSFRSASTKLQVLPSPTSKRRAEVEAFAPVSCVKPNVVFVPAAVVSAVCLALVLVAVAVAVASCVAANTP